MEARIKNTKVKSGIVVCTIFALAFCAAIMSTFMFSQKAFAAGSYNGYCSRSGFYEFKDIWGTFDNLVLDQNNPSSVQQNTVYNFGTGTSYNSKISNLKMYITKDNKLVLEYKIDTPFYSFFLGGTDIYPDVYIKWRRHYDNEWLEEKLPVKHWNDNCDYAGNKHVLYDFNADPYYLWDVNNDLQTALQLGDIVLSLEELTLIS